MYSLVESGGDWDRRNRLKSYSGLHLLSVRHYSDAAHPLLDSLSTFTSTEICPYSTLVLYAVLAGTVSLNRVDFKKKVLDSAEVLGILGSKPIPSAGSGEVDMMDVGSTEGYESLEALINSIYVADYQSFFRALAEVEVKFLSRDRLLAEHKPWFVREMRRRAYAQLLESYRVVSLQNMADSFGVSVDWLDRYVPRDSLSRSPADFGVVISRSSSRPNSSTVPSTG